MKNRQRCPGGGFRRRGCFLEDGDKSEYEFPEFVTLETLAHDLHHQWQWGFGWGHPPRNESGDLIASDGQVLIGKSSLRPSTYGQYSLSFFGSTQRHTIVDLSIHRGPGRHALLVGLAATAADDLDLSWDEHFAMDVRLDVLAFDQLVEALRSDSRQAVVVSMRVDEMPHLYTTWSPSISEGRMLKLLDRKSDIQNPDDVPDNFEDRAIPNGLPFSVRLVRRDPDAAEPIRD